MHAEFIAVPLSLLKEIRLSLDNPATKIIAVGTTSVRILESLYHTGRLILAGKWDGEVPQWLPYQLLENELASESIPTASEALDAIIAHLEAIGQATLVASTRIIIAPGYEYRLVKGIITNFHQPKYDYALSHSFRFLSYGDATLLL